MSLVITERPSTPFQSNTCRHSAVGNPVIYLITRKDYLTATITDSAGNLRITYVGDLTSVISTGASLYFRSDNGVYDGYYTVSTISYSAPDTTITFSGGYTAAGTTGFINLVSRLNYKASIEVWNNTGAYLIGTLRVSPDSRGELLVDVSRLLWSDLDPSVPTNYTFAQENASNLWLDFYIKTQGIWIGGSISQVSDSANVFYGVYAARQIGDFYGGFMADYLSYNTQGTESPKLLTKFRPKMWRKLHFAISGLFAHDILTMGNFELDYKDVTGASIITGATGSTAIAGELSTLIPINVQLMPENAVTLEVRTDRSGVSGLMDYETIDIVEPCDNPILLEWVNSLGGKQCYALSYKQEYSYTYDDGVKARRFVLFADNLTLEEWEGINDLNRPTEIYSNNITRLTPSVNKTKSQIGAQCFMYDYRGAEIEVVSVFDAGGSVGFIASKDLKASQDFKDKVLINSNGYRGYYYIVSDPADANQFFIADLITQSYIAYGGAPTFVEAMRFKDPVGVVVIPTEQTTSTKQQRHSISITIELPQIYTT